MITKQRLEELIQKRATIWVANKYCYAYSVDLDINYIGIADGKDSLFTLDYSINDKGETVLIDYLEYLFETKEDAEEFAEFGNITRTERLELPSWESIENIIEQKKRFGLNHSDRVLARIITKDSIYYFKICKDLDLFTFELKQTYIGEDLCEELTSRFPVSLGKVNKTNYDKARRLCIKLFKGEDV